MSMAIMAVTNGFWSPKATASRMNGLNFSLFSTNCGANGVPSARAAQAELIAHGAVDEELAQRDGQAQAERDRLALGSQDFGALGGAAEAVEDPALERRRVGALYLHRRQHVLPDARRRQDQRRS